MREIYRRIWRETGRAQIVLMGLSILVAVMAAVHLQYQKDIVNGLAESMAHAELFVLGAQFLGILILTNGLNFALGYRTSILSENAVRTIRTRIFLEHARKSASDDEEALPQSTLGTMIAAEAEELGKFAGGAFATPLVQVGVVVSVIAFIASTQPLLGVFVLGIVVPQAVIALRVQKHINLRVAERVKILRRATKRIVGEDIQRVEQAVLADFDEIVEARRKIYLFKLSTKFAMNSINALGTAGVLVLGGWFVLEGRTDIGTVVADLAGLARIAQPWREILAFYRNLSAARVKFELLKTALPKG